MILDQLRAEIADLLQLDMLIIQQPSGGIRKGDRFTVRFMVRNASITDFRNAALTVFKTQHATPQSGDQESHPLPNPFNSGAAWFKDIAYRATSQIGSLNPPYRPPVNPLEQYATMRVTADADVQKLLNGLSRERTGEHQFVSGVMESWRAETAEAIA